MSDENATGSIEAALEQAVSGTTSASQTGTATEAPAAVTPTTTTPVAAPVEKSVEVGKDKPGPVPYDRFHEKVEEVQSLSAKMAEMEARLNQAVAREENLNTQVRDLESEASVLDQIRSLAEDEQWRPTLEKLDAKLRGIEELVEQGDKTEEQGEVETAKVIQQAKSELKEAFEEQQTDFIVMQARDISDRYISQLPEGYTEAERQVIAEMLTPRVDWDAIAEDPKNLPKIMAEGLKSTLHDYGEPRGALEARLTEFNQTVTTSEPPPSNEETEKQLLETDWSEQVKSEDGSVSSKYSDEDFAKALATRLKMR